METIPRTPRAEEPGEASNPDKDGAVSTINSPEINSSGKPTKRAITTASQAHGIAKAAVQRAREGRIKTAAVIAEKYNGAPPFNPADLVAAGQNWRNNFSTNFLASIIDRVKPQMLDPINKTNVLTHSVLPAKIDDSATKSRTFCEVTTKTIRRWSEWRNFASQLAQEVVVYGLATPAWIDSKTEWRPRLWRFDEAFFPEGTGQHASSVPLGIFSQKMLLHEFIALFEDKEIAEKACYNYRNCIVAANTTRDGKRSTDPTELEAQDRKREGAGMSDSYSDDGAARTVDLYHILVQDYTGEVDLWTVTQDSGIEIRSIQNLHESMEDGICLFTFQSGNNKLYGSKGLGRILTNIHIAVERGRCLGADQMYLSGLVIFKSNSKNSAAVQATVRHPFVFVDENLEVVTEQIQFDTQAFEMMDAKLTQLADSIAGAFIPPNLNNEGANTKIEAAQNAERELAVKEGVLGRFFDHLADLVSAMQRKIYSPINLREGFRAWEKKKERTEAGIKVLMRRVWKLLKEAFKDTKAEPDLPESGPGDEEAVAAVVELLDAGLSIEEIATLALSPSAQSNAQDGSTKDAATVAFIAGNVTNPFVDQREATLMAAEITVGKDRAAQLIIPKEDPQVETIAIRAQLIECGQMLAGEAMPVALSDKHDTHRQTLSPKIEGLMQTVTTAPTPDILNAAELFVSHYNDHLKLDMMMSPEAKQQEGKIVAEEWATIQKVRAAMQKIAENMPVPVNGQPPQVGPDGNIIGERQSIHPEDAELKLKVRESEQEDQRIALEHKKLDLKADEVAHKQAVESIKLQQDNVGMVQDAAEAQMQVGQKEADRDLQETLAAEANRMRNEKPKE